VYKVTRIQTPEALRVPRVERVGYRDHALARREKRAVDGELDPSTRSLRQKVGERGVASTRYGVARDFYREDSVHNRHGAKRLGAPGFVALGGVGVEGHSDRS
jgi:hypothetical protein